MDYIREFDIRLEKEMYYAGEVISGHVILDTIENFKLRAIRVVLRGKAHTEWKVIVSGDRRTVKDDQYFIDDRAIIWGKENISSVPVLPRGQHKFSFKFQLPESSLPPSFESKAGTIRYYIKATVDIPYASPPQGLKYLTIVGPHLDVMEDQYLKPMVGQAKRTTCCLCCERGPVSLKTQLDRSAYVCGESLRLKADIDNQTEEEARLQLKLVQYVEYYIDRGVLGVTKEVNHTILEYKGPAVAPHTRSRWDSGSNLIVSTMPPTLLGVCRLLQIYYVLKVNLSLEKSGEDLHMHFPITIATVPFRIPNNPPPKVHYDVASDHAEGGMYIGPEFQLGGVYDGLCQTDDIVLYRPVYLTISNPNKPIQQKQDTIDGEKSSGSTTQTPKKDLKVTINLPSSSKSANGNGPPASPKTPKGPGTGKRVSLQDSSGGNPGEKKENNPNSTTTTTQEKSNSIISSNNSKTTSSGQVTISNTNTPKSDTNSNGSSTATTTTEPTTIASPKEKAGKSKGKSFPGKVEKIEKIGGSTTTTTTNKSETG